VLKTSGLIIQPCAQFIWVADLSYEKIAILLEIFIHFQVSQNFDVN